MQRPNSSESNVRLDGLEIRPVRAGEALELLAMSGVLGLRNAETLAARPLPRYAVVDEHRHVLIATMPRGDAEANTVGMASIVVEPEHAVGELHLFIRPDVRARGIGRRLFAAALDDARRHGLSRLRLRLRRHSVSLLGMVLRASPHPVISRDADTIVVDLPLGSES